MPTLDPQVHADERNHLGRPPGLALSTGGLRLPVTRLWPPWTRSASSARYLSHRPACVPTTKGHTNRPFSSRLANKHRPCPSHHSTLIRSPHCTSFSIPIAICCRGVSVASALRSVRSNLWPTRTCRSSDPLHRGPAGSVTRDPGMDVRCRGLRGGFMRPSEACDCCPD